MKRILVLSFTFPPNADGVSRPAYFLAQGLAQRGYTVGVGTEFRPDRELDAYRPLLVRHFRVTGTSSLRDRIHGEIDEFLSFVTGFGPDVVFCECWDLWTTVLALRAFRHTNVKLVLVSHGYTFHSVDWHPQFPFGLGQWLARLPAVFAMPFTMRRFDFVVVNSERRDFGRFFDRVIADLTGYSKCVVIPNPINLAEFERPALDFRQAHGIGAGPLFLCLANYSERKNQMMALKAFRKAAVDGSTLVFIGSEFNDYSARLDTCESRLRASGAGAGTVLLLEKVDRPMVIAALKACDIFVLSARAETMPVALMEAMAAGKPFISTDTGCVRELPGGIIVRDETELRDAMKSLAQDAARQAELGGKGRAACEAGFSVEKVLDRFESLIK